MKVQTILLFVGVVTALVPPKKPGHTTNHPLDTPACKVNDGKSAADSSAKKDNIN
ncbi:hypothetical protein FKW77_001374 [Venturia effusa]|uniref:Uncharacterized protein n=1 Tax=Venturia effusa TaxID=50376 RepID=A0A517LM78_9PEZI|nr:hypothetical protein FKW77_001374 [Venturia effusa]